MFRFSRLGCGCVSKPSERRACGRRSKIGWRRRRRRLRPFGGVHLESPAGWAPSNRPWPCRRRWAGSGGPPPVPQNLRRGACQARTCDMTPASVLCAVTPLMGACRPRAVARCPSPPARRPPAQGLGPAARLSLHPRGLRAPTSRPQRDPERRRPASRPCARRPRWSAGAAAARPFLGARRAAPPLRLEKHFKTFNTFEYKVRSHPGLPPCRHRAPPCCWIAPPRSR